MLAFLAWWFFASAVAAVVWSALAGPREDE
jgi:hypothetical protein